ncbi:hypothetical protein A7E75_10160 [Syntrophotalea acetylenica]|uniref:DUF721 domain-containing protein n=2 Tax=Syntrophotaleaceae TaxID=2812024 RepID=A0A1L3GHF9_SYNAC|nr:hypothetical protein A7E75_10160 [Syntrophotalea acetylenica]APG43409.1 hypothetical protein A6070_04165 [Syntrophotalea acetylenica]
MDPSGNGLPRSRQRRHNRSGPHSRTESIAMSSSRNRIDGIQRVLQQWLAGRGMDEKFGRYRVWQLWEEAVGPQIAARARPIRLRGTTLEVRVDHPIWMQQLQLLKPRILSRLNAQLGDHRIDDLYLRHGRPNEVAADVQPDPLPPQWQDQPLTEEERRQIEHKVATVADPELRRHLRHLMEMQCRLDKARGERQDKPSR